MPLLENSIASDEDYIQIASRCEDSFDVLRDEGVVRLAPKINTPLRMSFQRTELGTSPRTLLGVLGLHDTVSDFVVTNLVPRCPGCGESAVAPRSVDSLTLPEEGTIALVVSDLSAETPLRERCEFLGAERGCVDGYLLTIDELGDQIGQPVVAVVAVRDRNRLRVEAAAWFARGGGELGVLHYRSRTDRGVQIGSLTGAWTCPRCAHSVQVATRRELLDAPVCETCRGAGWLVSSERADNGRYVACRDCDGLGFTTIFAAYDFFGTTLRSVSLLTFAILRELVSKTPGTEALRGYLTIVCEAGLGHYSLGALYDLFSVCERALVTIANVRLAGLQGVKFLIDGAYGDLTNSDLISIAAESGLVVALPPRVVREASKSLVSHAEELVLRDVHQGPLCIDELHVPSGALTALQGPVGSGKSLLLSIVADRFAKRRIHAHQASFGSLKECVSIPGIQKPSGTLLERLGLSEVLADEIARSRRAKELGILPEDLILPGSKYRCSECGGVGLGTTGEVCQECEGALYDWRVARLPLVGSTVAEIMREPLLGLLQLPWSGDDLPAALETVAPFCRKELSLSASIGSVEPTLRRFLAVAARLAILAKPSKESHLKLPKQLILIDGPSAMPACYGEVLGGLLQSLVLRGATVVYASMPQTLESWCHSVVRLRWLEQDVSLRAKERYLDRRFSRRSGVGDA